MSKIQLLLALLFTFFILSLPAYAETTVRKQDYHKCMEEESKTGNLSSAKMACCERVGGTWVEVETNNTPVADSYCEVSGEAMPVVVSPDDPRRPKDPRRPVGPRPDTVDPGAKPTQPVDPTLRQTIVPAPKNAGPAAAK